MPANSFFGALGMFSIVLKISSRSAFGLIILPPFVGMPLIGAKRLQEQVLHKLSYKRSDLLRPHGLLSGLGGRKDANS